MSASSVTLLRQAGWIPAVAAYVAAAWAPPALAAAALPGAAALLLLWALAVFATADADLWLVFCGPLAQHAFRDRVVLVTGASRGVGKALAQHLALRGAKLILSSRSAAALEEVKQSCKGEHAAGIVVAPLDVTAPWDAMAKFADQVDAAFDGIDYVFHVAGASQSAAAEDSSMFVAEQMIALNMLGPIALTRALLPHMLRRRRGRFVVVASMAAKVPSPGQSLYAASKQGLYGYFSSLSTELAGRGVGVTIVCPGPVAAEGEQRTLFGPEKLETRPVDRSVDGKKVAMGRAVQLICAAAAHKLDEAWIAKHPVLMAGYIMQYWPALGWMLMKKIGPKRVAALKSGKSGYDYKLMSNPST